MNSCKKDDGSGEGRLLLSSEESADRIYDDPKRKCVFEGTQLEQKFTSKKLFDKRFVWINLSTRSIHMSEHVTKERRHKEASIADIIDVTLGLPKIPAQTGGGDNPDLGMTIVFKKGGGIDLHFSNKETRDVWYDTVKSLVE